MANNAISTKGKDKQGTDECKDQGGRPKGCTTNAKQVRQIIQRAVDKANTETAVALLAGLPAPPTPV
ncbi:hypothetical protein BGZ65_011501, partial [Modicella reniformis]